MKNIYENISFRVWYLGISGGTPKIPREGKILDARLGWFIVIIAAAKGAPH